MQTVGPCSNANTSISPQQSLAPLFEYETNINRLALYLRNSIKIYTYGTYVHMYAHSDINHQRY